MRYQRPQGITYGRKPDCLTEELWSKEIRAFGVDLSAAWLLNAWWCHHTRQPDPENDEWSIFIGPYIQHAQGCSIVLIPKDEKYAKAGYYEALLTPAGELQDHETLLAIMGDTLLFSTDRKVAPRFVAWRGVCPDDVECDPKDLASFLWTRGVTDWAFSFATDLVGPISSKVEPDKARIIEWFREVPEKPIRPMSRGRSVFTGQQDEMLFVDEFYA